MTELSARTGTGRTAPARTAPGRITPAQPTPARTAAGHVAIEVLDGAGRAVAVDFSIRRDTVEAWTAGRCSAVFDRWLLRAWLCAPAGMHGFDDVTWARSGTGVALTVEHAFPWWVLAPRDLQRLRDLV
jgi:hypothetical protein